MAAGGGKTPELGVDDGTLDMAALVGSLVRLQLLDGSVVDQAEVFAYDAKTGMVVVQQRLPHVVRKRNVRVVRENFIKDIEYLGREERTDLSRPLPAIQYDRLKQREAAAVAKAKAALGRIGVGVSAQGQLVFDTLAKTLPCTWDGTTMVVMESVRISPPYRPEDCVSTTGDERALGRLKMMLGNIKAPA